MKVQRLSHYIIHKYVFQDCNECLFSLLDASESFCKQQAFKTHCDFSNFGGKTSQYFEAEKYLNQNITTDQSLLPAFHHVFISYAKVFFFTRSCSLKVSTNCKGSCKDT